MPRPLFLALAPLILCLAAAPAGAADERPNLLFFIADDLAWDDLGAYGHPHIRTPNIDRLAAEGLRFDRAFLTCSSCSPSRSSIITGRYPHSTGAEALHWPLPAEQVTFVERLKQAGYHTAQAGKWHLGDAVRDRFDTVADGGEAMVETLRDRPRDKPFFMWFAFHDPHRPYQRGAIATPHTREDVVVPSYLPDLPEVRDELALYYDEISRLDELLGRVLAELASQGVADNTLILLTSDNGRPFPRCKTTVFDSGIHAPFIVRWPAKVAPGGSTMSLVSSIDIAPTFLELAGLPVTPNFQGVSFAPILADPGATVREHVFAEHNWHDYTAHKRAVRDANFKYIRNAYPDLPGTPPADAVKGDAFQAMLRLRDEGKLDERFEECFVAPRPEEELYDLSADPDEHHNLAADPKYAKVLAELRARLTDWKLATGDRVPELRTPDDFDRRTGDRLRRRGGLNFRSPIREQRVDATQ